MKVRIVNGKVPLWAHLYLWASEWVGWLVFSLIVLLVIGGGLTLSWAIFSAMVRAAQ